jgi:hypothetical protein
MGKAERDTGKRGEREARDRLKPLWAAIRRGLGQSIGALEADLEETPIRWEVKWAWSQWPQVEAALAQVKADAEKYSDPRPRAVVHKRKKKQKGTSVSTDWRITFELDEFVRFVQMMRGE